ncbi:MAG: DMT family transporter [Defluviitaleaceae bacterium]|nr:DMT family transporter [Defluviitaleaceae bacterium]MCL2836519.1 DMT family transporter [Defluviitaleaceae bacterium]
MERFNVKGNVMVLITTMIWGAAFVAQRSGMEHVDPFTFLAVRFFIGGCVTMAAAPLFARMAKTRQSFTDLFSKGTIKAGMCCGAALFIAASLQQSGMQYTTAGKGGFLTTLYVIFVPIIGLFLRKKPRVWVWFGMALAVAGTYFLSVNEGFTINQGDLLILCCALFFAFHILIIDRFAGSHDGIAMSSVQFFTVSVFAGVFMVLFETPRVSDIIACTIPLLYTGLLSSGVAYTLQIKVQKITAPSVAAILLSMESVFAALAGYLFIAEILTARELLGCALVLAAVITAQIPGKKHREISNR